MWFLILMQLNLEYGSKRQRTSVKRIKSQRSSWRVFFSVMHSLYSCVPGVTCSFDSYLKQHFNMKT
uniref:Putative ovule protein n=1 Tax=Solanum chacoense TaxID=4108 RepID=A0A0V0GEX8_SOLCH